jgi:hypothetical protein
MKFSSSEQPNLTGVDTNSMKIIFFPNSQSIHCYRKNTKSTKIIQDISSENVPFLFLEN